MQEPVDSLEPEEMVDPEVVVDLEDTEDLADMEDLAAMEEVAVTVVTVAADRPPAAAAVEIQEEILAVVVHINMGMRLVLPLIIFYPVGVEEEEELQVVLEEMPGVDGGRDSITRDKVMKYKYNHGVVVAAVVEDLVMQEMQEIQEVQEIQEIQAVEEMQAVQEIQEIQEVKEMQEIQEIQVLTAPQIPEMPEVPLLLPERHLTFRLLHLHPILLP